MKRVFLPPGAALPLDKQNDSAWRPERPPEQAVPVSVCAEIDASRLLALGDFWEGGSEYSAWDGADMQACTTVLVDSDGVYQELITAFVDRGELYAIQDPADDPEGEVIASVRGPYHICFYAPLTAGVHRVDVRFERSSGEILSYAWTFKLLTSPPPGFPDTRSPDFLPPQFPNRLLANFPIWRYTPTQGRAGMPPSALPRGRR